MPKPDTIFICSKCDAQYPKWQGRCAECGSWGTIGPVANTSTKIAAATTGAPAPIFNLSQVESIAGHRLPCQIAEVDRVLGGGIVPGSLIILGGDPGIGKSTLALQIAGQITSTLYVSGEESLEQIKLRADRINLPLPAVSFITETSVETIIATASQTKPQLIIIDSIQTLRTDAVDSGSLINQLTATTAKLMELAKSQRIAIILIGHVTKEGVVAGPKTIEHLVDAVLYLENDTKHYYKLLRSVKNRFGSTGEIGIFEMTGTGLVPAANPSALFLEAGDTKRIGQAATVIMEGTRPFLIDIEALVTKTVFGYPQRKTAGIDANRLQMILAVLSKVNKLNLLNYDVYISVVGGLKIRETAADLAMAAAIVSAFLDLAIDRSMVFIGEISLAGAIRPVHQSEQRIKEAQSQGFTKIIIPHQPKIKKSPLLHPISQIGEIVQLINATKT